jgi:hypothetical protein
MFKLSKFGRFVVKMVSYRILLRPLENSRNKEEYHYKLLIGWWLAIRLELPFITNFLYHYSRDFLPRIFRTMRIEAKKHIEDLWKEISAKDHIIPENLKGPL